MYRHWHQLRPRQQKPTPLIALGIVFLCLYLSNYINSLQANTVQVDSVSNISDTERHFRREKFFPKDASSTQSINSLEQSVYEQINEHRESKGLSPLVLDGWLSQQAREHSEAMAKGDISFDREILDQLNQKIIKTGPYQSAGTAIGMTLGYANPAQANVNNWLQDVYGDNSTTIDSEYELTGVGVAMNLKGEYYFTQIFLLR
ncbi:CAP domain-containing protein [Chlorogloea sp. CCALA 695]|uniref:CAP domain-containing protein n=1 Tax=Chlorogloea sp. CCALA 695 TaxID=2107693 RepID=UPI000D04D0FA|nr:CAP domain-containing protein [Chlorogloea sp. CCALA 695]PSB31182.1 hypothetical protein C7B70_14125 [Chlorogloea sp. CCALA 695]